MRQALYSIFRYLRSRALPFLLLALVVFLCMRLFREASERPGEGRTGGSAAAAGPGAGGAGPGGGQAVADRGATFELAGEVPGLLERNRGPGRIVFLLLEMKGSQVRLTGGLGAAGDFELGPARRPRPGSLLVEFHDEAGKLLGSTVVEDPQRRFMEWPDEAEPGRLRSMIVESEDGNVSLRLPGNLYPASLTLYRPVGSELRLLAKASLR